MAVRGQSSSNFNWGDIMEKAKSSWLKTPELLYVLKNHSTIGLTLNLNPPSSPPSGSIFLFDKNKVKFKKDGIQWKRGKDKKIALSREFLKVDGVKQIVCVYNVAEEVESFRRRIYTLFEGDSSVVLVHYLDERMISREEKETKGRSRQKALSRTRSSENNPIINETNMNIGNLNNFNIPFGFDSIPLIQEPIQVEEVLEQGFSNNTGNIKNQFLTVKTENSDHYSSRSQSPFGRSYESTNEMNNLNPPISLQNNNLINSNFNTSPYSKSPLLNNPIHSFIDSQILKNQVNSLQLIQLTDYTPNCDFLEGNSKMILLSPSFVRFSPFGIERKFFIVFDTIEVPTEFIQDGAIRCFTPIFHKPEIIQLYISVGNFTCISQTFSFEYKINKLNLPENNLKNNHSNNLASKLSLSNKILNRVIDIDKMKFVIHLLLSKWHQELCPFFPSILRFSLPKSPSELSESFIYPFLTENILEPLKTLRKEDKINEQEPEGGLSLLHAVCALGYSKIASCLIEFGIDVNLKDKKNYSAFQWAVNNGSMDLIHLFVDWNVERNKANSVVGISPRGSQKNKEIIHVNNNSLNNSKNNSTTNSNANSFTNLLDGMNNNRSNLRNSINNLSENNQVPFANDLFSDLNLNLDNQSDNLFFESLQFDSSSNNNSNVNNNQEGKMNLFDTSSMVKKEESLIREEGKKQEQESLEDLRKGFEEMGLHLDDIEVQQAAVIIQSVYRAHRTREKQKMRLEKERQAAMKIQAVFRSYLGKSKKEKSKSRLTKDDEEEKPKKYLTASDRKKSNASAENSDSGGLNLNQINYFSNSSNNSNTQLLSGITSSNNSSSGMRVEENEMSKKDVPSFHFSFH